VFVTTFVNSGIHKKKKSNINKLQYSGLVDVTFGDDL